MADATASPLPTITIEAFDPATSTWTRYLKRVEGAFRILQVRDELKVPYLLQYIGSTAYNVVADRLAPAEPYAQTYEKITSTLQKFFEPAPLEVAENFKLMQRKQLEGESAKDFHIALQKLSLNCNMGEYTDTALRNYFIYGLRNKRIQNRLLEIPDLNLERALQTATAMELSEKEVQQFRGEEAVAPLGTTQKKNTYRDKSLVSKKFPRINVNTGKENKQHERDRRVTCYRCGKNHYASVCTMNRNIKCLKCGKAGHLRKVCKSSTNTNTTFANSINSSNYEILFAEHTQFRQKIYTTLNVNNKNVRFEIDSGAAVTLMSRTDAKRFFSGQQIYKTQIQLISYCKTQIQVLGYIRVTVRCGELLRKLNLYITTENREPLLGREWILQLKENKIIQNFLGELQSIHNITDGNKLQLQALLTEFTDLTNTSIAKITGIQAKLVTKEKTNTVFCKPRPVPFRLRVKVEEELDKLTEAGILEKVHHSEWATPIVPVIKKNGTIRICGDYSVTINPKLKVDEHPLPTPDELLTQMAGGTVFSKIDLLQAYLQLEVRSEDRELLTLNTHKGLYRPTRLMYGVASAPAIWQRTIENILRDIPGVVVFLDDIRIAGLNAKDHLQKLREVFTRLRKYNIRINAEKSEFFTNQIQYCGYIIDKNGLHKAPDKVEAINKMRTPSNITELRSFLGMIHYYDRFIPNLSTILKPLNQLLQKNTRFIWSTECEKSFQAAKQAFTSPKCLVHFDPKVPVTLATDASPYGVGAVLSHIYPDGTERVIQYASKTLSKTQQAYSQIDKEAFAIIYGIKKFYQYLQGAKFTLVTDHRPLTQIFSPTKSLPLFTASRMQHYALFLQSFNYDIKYRRSELHANADCLSRLPVANTNVDECDSIDIFQNSVFNTLPVTAKQVAENTLQDKELSKLHQILSTGKGFYKENKFHTVPITEFTLFQNVIFRGHRVVIPYKLQKQILQELHAGHFGMVRMKSLARSYVWWNGIDKDIEKLVSNCANCNTFKNNPPKITGHIWEPTSTPFERVHIDFAGPFLGHYFLILVDAHTKWPEIHVVKNITSITTIDVCRQIFATYGLPQYLVSDNGRTFISKEFTNFLQANGIVHKLVAPYHPASNGQAERYVQILKNSLKRMNATPYTIQPMLQKLLLQYRNTPHAKTGISPAQALFSRNLRTRLDLLSPTITNATNKFTSPISFTEGKRVSCRNYTGNYKWLFGTVLKRLGNLHYSIQLDDGRIWKRHVNQLRSIGENTPKRSEDYIQLDYDTSCDNSTNNNSSNSSKTIVFNNTSENVTPTLTSPSPSFSEITPQSPDFVTPSTSFKASTPRVSPEPTIIVTATTSTTTPTPTNVHTRPTRLSKLPLRLQDYVLGKN